MLPAGVARELDSLSWHWGGAYAVAGPAPGSPGWIAARADDCGAIWAPTAEDLRIFLRADYRARPVSRDQWPPFSDRLLERFRARHPGWAVVAREDGYAAYRFRCRLAGATLPELDREMRAAGLRAGRREPEALRA